MTKARISATPREVRNFGFLFAGISGVAAAYMRFAGVEGWSWLLVAAVFFLAAAFIGYAFLRPIYVAWMTFAFVLGWINTRLLLGLFFYLILTPTGLILKLFGKDVLDQRIDRSVGSYWKLRERKPFDSARYEKLF